MSDEPASSATPRLVVLGAILAAGVAATIVLTMRHADRQDVGLGSVVALAGTAERAAEVPLARAVRLSDAEEERIGDALAAEDSVRLSGDQVLRAYVAAVGEAVGRSRQRQGIHLSFIIVDSEMANAWALPGGRVHVTTAMLEVIDDEAELAALLGHEIAHVDLRHCADGVTLRVRAGQGLGAPGRLGADVVAALTQPSYSEEQEIEADVQGMRLAAAAGYDPAAARDLLEKVRGLEHEWRSSGSSLDAGRITRDALERYFASHPPPEDRLRALAPELRRLLSDDTQRERYRGVRNFRDRVPRASMDLAEEHVVEDAVKRPVTESK